MTKLASESLLVSPKPARAPTAAPAPAAIVDARARAKVSAAADRFEGAGAGGIRRERVGSALPRSPDPGAARAALGVKAGLLAPRGPGGSTSGFAERGSPSVRREAPVAAKIPPGAAAVAAPRSAAKAHAHGFAAGHLQHRLHARLDAELGQTAAVGGLPDAARMPKGAVGDFDVAKGGASLGGAGLPAVGGSLGAGRDSVRDRARSFGGAATSGRGRGMPSAGRDLGDALTGVLGNFEEAKKAYDRGTESPRGHVGEAVGAGRAGAFSVVGGVEVDEAGDATIGVTARYNPSDDSHVSASVSHDTGSGETTVGVEGGNGFVSGSGSVTVDDSGQVGWELGWEASDGTVSVGGSVSGTQSGASESEVSLGVGPLELSAEFGDDDGDGDGSVSAGAGGVELELTTFGEDEDPDDGNAGSDDEGTDGTGEAQGSDDPPPPAEPEGGEGTSTGDDGGGDDGDGSGDDGSDDGDGDDSSEAPEGGEDGSSRPAPDDNGGGGDPDGLGGRLGDRRSGAGGLAPGDVADPSIDWGREGQAPRGRGVQGEVSRYGNPSVDWGENGPPQHHGRVDVEVRGAIDPSVNPTRA